MKFLFSYFFLLVNSAFAQGVAADAPLPPPTFGEIFSQMIPLLIIVASIFYFMVSRPQEKKQKAHQALLATLKKGESVVTTAGIIGRVAAIEKDYILLEVSSGVKIKFEPSYVLKRVDKKDTTEVQAA